MWLDITLKWYIPLFFLGIIFFPISHRILGKFFPDCGFAFAKTVGIILVSYSIFVLGVLKILPFTTPSLFGLILCFGVISLYFGRTDKLINKIKTRNTFFLIIFEELLFLGGLILWAYVRGQEPAIRGLEKFMDFGFINSALRADYFPPKDIWLAGHNLNYYYFGHITGAVLTKLAAVPSYISYNLILATLFALGVVQTFSLCLTIVQNAYQKTGLSIVAGILGSFITNFAGNLHTIYLFTTGYNTDKPVPFWQILSKYAPEKYWYPNATRFIPFTIHEFPIYSYVVADLHGHVFDIPFVLLTIALLFTLFLSLHQEQKEKTKQNFQFSIFNFQFLTAVFLGFLTAVHYMTNAFDGPIYLLLSAIIFLLLFGFSRQFFTLIFTLASSFVLFSLPFSANFDPFVSGIGVNCAPSFLTNLGKLGPFLFENGNCQVSQWWMLMTLWGFFWFNFAFFLLIKRKQSSTVHTAKKAGDYFILALFSLGTLLIIIPEFFYIKDIYPAHFRANTMFKLGYQAFIMMSIASTFVFFYFKQSKNSALKTMYIIGFGVVFFLVALYPHRAVTSYYGTLKNVPQLDGTGWIKTTYADYIDIITYLNHNVSGQPTILEAQGDSYTDFNVVSAYTGLPTVAGWWVHEWLWRGDSKVVGSLIPSIQSMYEGEDIKETKRLLEMYQVAYIIIGPNERKKYPQLKQKKLEELSNTVIQTPEGSLLLKVN